MSWPISRPGLAMLTWELYREFLGVLECAIMTKELLGVRKVYVSINNEQIWLFLLRECCISGEVKPKRNVRFPPTYLKGSLKSLEWLIVHETAHVASFNSPKFTLTWLLHFWTFWVWGNFIGKQGFIYLFILSCWQKWKKYGNLLWEGCTQRVTQFGWNECRRKGKEKEGSLERRNWEGGKESQEEFRKKE